MESSRFNTAVQKIDQANAQDPHKEIFQGKEYPKELLYSIRMSAWLDKLRPEAPEVLKLAARAQHIRRWEVCEKADSIGSTEGIKKKITEAPSGSKFAVGTEIHLVNRLAKQNPDKLVITLDDSGCLCTTMFRISPQHLLWALENLAEGNVVNRIEVPAEVKRGARLALDRMLEIH